MRPVAVWLVAFVPALSFLLLFPVEVIDDAYISFRYTHNFVLGHGLVYNPGDRVEGMTNLLWTLLLAVPVRAGLSVDRVAALAGAAFGALALVDGGRICRRLGISTRASAAALFAVGLYAHFWYTVANGLEGGLFAFLLARTILAVVAAAPVRAGLWGGLLFMVRPEGLALIPLAAAVWLVAPEQRRGRPRWTLSPRLVLMLLSWLALVGSVTLWRRAYYGALLPNSLTAKSPPLEEPAVILESVGLGARYVLGFALSAAPLGVGALLAPLLGRRSRAVWLILAMFGVQVVAVLVNGGDWMQHHRLLAVYAPLLAVLLATTLQRLAGPPLGAPLPAWCAPWGAGLALVAALVLMLGRSTVPWRESTFPAPALRLRLNSQFSCYGAVADALAPALRPDDRVAAEALGVLGYRLRDFYVHDPLGLTDRHIARHGVEYRRRVGKLDLAYTLTQIRPVVIITHGVDISVPALVRASDGRFGDEYATYLVDHPAQCDQPVTVSVHRERVADLEPALRAATTVTAR